MTRNEYLAYLDEAFRILDGLETYPDAARKYAEKYQKDDIVTWKRLWAAHLKSQ